MNPKKILLVEDSIDDIELVRIALSAKKIANSLDIVMDGEEALEYLFCKGQYASREPAVNPVLILLDLQLPKVSGLEVLKQLRANPSTQFIPVVIFTSSNRDEDVLRSYELGANSFIQKPVDGDQFEKAVQELGMYWLILNEPLE